jgi:mRNA interferase RelE/StbE
MKVIVSPLAEKQLRKFSKVNQIIIAKKIRAIVTTPQGTGSEQLKGYKNIYRTRLGDLRIVYRKSKHELYIILIGHRRDIYEKLKRLFS